MLGQPRSVHCFRPPMHDAFITKCYACTVHALATIKICKDSSFLRQSKCFFFLCSVCRAHRDTMDLLHREHAVFTILCDRKLCLLLWKFIPGYNLGHADMSRYDCSRSSGLPVSDQEKISVSFRLV